MFFVCGFFALVLAYAAAKVEAGGVRIMLIVFCLLNLLGVGQGIYDGNLERFGLKGRTHVTEGSYKGP